jgi:hypothetical protein
MREARPTNATRLTGAAPGCGLPDAARRTRLAERTRPANAARAAGGAAKQPAGSPGAALVAAYRDALERCEQQLAASDPGDCA